MRATVTTTHDRCVGILDGQTVAHFPDGCPDPGDYNITLDGTVNTTGEPRALVASCTPAKTKRTAATAPTPEGEGRVES